jgi:hypothetical protein
MGEEAITGMESLQAALGAEAVGQVRQVSVVRGGNLVAVPVTIGERS